MTPEAKAKLLYESLLPHSKNVVQSPVGWVQVPGEREKHAKSCAKLCCKEIIAALPPILGHEYFGPNSPMSKEEAVSNPAIDYWNHVLTEIGTL